MTFGDRPADIERVFGLAPFKDVKDYQNSLEAHIYLNLNENREFVYNGVTYKLTNKKAVDAISDTKDVRYLVQRLKDMAQVQGLTASLPFYREIQQRRTTPEWVEMQRAFIGENASADKQQDFENALAAERFGLSEKQFAASEQQRAIQNQLSQYSIAVQQQRDKQAAVTAAQEGLWENWRTNQNLLAAQTEFQAQRFANFGRQDQGITNEERAKIFESARGELLGSLTGPADWIKRWEVQNAPNKWQVPSEQKTQEDITQAKQEVSQYKDAVKIIRERQKNPNDPLFIPAGSPEATPFTPEQTWAWQMEKGLRTAEDKLLEFTTQPEFTESRQFARGVPNEQGGLDYGGPATPAAQKPTGPATPTWLKNLYPQLGSTVTPISNLGQVSGQGFNRLTQSQQAGLMGFAEFSGADPGAIIPTFNKRQTGGRATPFGQRTSV